MWGWWWGSLTGSLSRSVPLCGWHCLIPLSRLVPLLRTAHKLKVLQSGSWSKVGVGGRGAGGKKLEQPQIIFGINRFTLRRWQGTGYRERGRTERLQGWREMWIKGFRERGQPTKVLLGSLIEASPRAFLWLCCTKRVFFIYLFNFMPCRPLSGPRPSPKLPCLSGCPQSLLQKNTSQRHCCVPVVVFPLVQ